MLRQNTERRVHADDVAESDRRPIPSTPKSDRSTTQPQSDQVSADPPQLEFELIHDIAVLLANSCPHNCRPVFEAVPVAIHICQNGRERLVCASAADAHLSVWACVAFRASDGRRVAQRLCSAFAPGGGWPAHVSIIIGLVFWRLPAVLVNPEVPFANWY